MEEDLISKKELLKLKGISYGTLYRWKRKKLIPDEWFIRKSTFTGQETFFPRSLILERVDSIMNGKEGTSLDDLADIFSGTPVEMSVTTEEMMRRELISSAAASIAEPFFSGMMDFDSALIVYSLDRPIESGEISSEDAKTVIRNVVAAEDKESLRHSVIRLYRKQGVVFCIISPDASDISADTASKLVFEIDMRQAATAFKVKILSNGGEENE